MTRISYNISNDLLKSAAKYALTHNTNFQRICQQIKSETQMHVQNVTSNYETKRIRKNVLKKLKSNFVTTWKETMTQSGESRPKVTYKQVQLNYNQQKYEINIKTIPPRAMAAIFSASRLKSMNAEEGPSLLNQGYVVSALRMRSKMRNTY